MKKQIKRRVISEIQDNILWKAQKTEAPAPSHYVVSNNWT